jgi:hypothetical protein
MDLGASGSPSRLCPRTEHWPLLSLQRIQDGFARSTPDLELRHLQRQCLEPLRRPVRKRRRDSRENVAGACREMLGLDSGSRHAAIACTKSAALYAPCHSVHHRGTANASAPGPRQRNRRAISQQLAATVFSEADLKSDQPLAYDIDNFRPTLTHAPSRACSAASTPSSSCRAHSPVALRPQARRRYAAPMPYRARRPTGRTNRCPR